MKSPGSVAVNFRAAAKHYKELDHSGVLDIALIVAMFQR